MLKIPLSYRLPVGVSIFLHVTLLIALNINVSTQNKDRFNNQNTLMPVISAVAVNQQTFNNQIKKMQQAEKQKRTAEKAACKEKLQQRTLALKKQRVAEQEQLLSMRAKQLKLQQQKHEIAAWKKALTIKKQKQEVLAKRQQQLQKKLLQQEMAQEKAWIAAKTQEMVQIQGILNQYKA